MENIETLKQQVKTSIIEEIGEEKYYKVISESLEKLVPIKESIDLLFPNESAEERKTEFKKAVMDTLVFERYEDDINQTFFIGYYELVLDVFEF